MIELHSDKCVRMKVGKLVSIKLQETEFSRSAQCFRMDEINFVIIQIQAFQGYHVAEEQFPDGYQFVVT